MARTRLAWLLLAAVLAIGGISQRAGQARRAQTPTDFAGQIAALSEPGGYFDTDNLISNETSYLQVLPDLRGGNVRGGAYIGVGPDQNFSYIAAVRPTIAFMVDIRRDSLLLHLLFKALFELSRTRLEYLALLTGRPVPLDLEVWRQAGIDAVVSYIDESSVHRQSLQTLRRRVDDTIRRTGVALSREDFETIARFHRRFIDAALELRFQSADRPPQGHYPTYRQLLQETDPVGNHGNFLAAEDAFQFVKSLQARHRIVPVVGDLSGPSALAAIGRMLSERGDRLSVIYASNVEFYLFREGTFPRFVANLEGIPRTDRSVVIRSVFGRNRPLGRAGDGSTSSIQRVDELLNGFSGGRIRSYDDLTER